MNLEIRIFDLRDKPKCIMPQEGGQCYALLIAFEKGERLTVFTALERYGVMALSQRCGDLKHKFGWPIQSKMIKTITGKDVAIYWMER